MRKLLMLVCAVSLTAACDDKKSTDEDTTEDADVVDDTDVIDDATEDVVDEDGPAPVPSRVVIFHTNDEHSHHLGVGPNMDDWPPSDTVGDGSVEGGIYRRAAVLQNERQALMTDGIPSLTVSAGDWSMGTLMHLGTAFNGLDLILMTILDYDAATIGNHEFDFGASTLVTILEEGGLFSGVPLAIPIVASNINFSTSSDSDDALEALYDWDGADGALVKGYHIEELSDGTRVGIIGYMGLGASLVAPFKSPVQFSLSMTETPCSSSTDCTGGGSCVDGLCTVSGLDDHASNMPALISEVASAVREVRGLGVDLVVALAHAGLKRGEVEQINAGTLAPADATSSEDIVVAYGVQALLEAEGLDGIDVTVSGHSHTVLSDPIVCAGPTPADHSTIIVQAGENGRFVGRLEIFRDDVDAPWQVDTVGSRVIPVNDTVDTSVLTLGMSSMIDEALYTVIDAVEPLMLVDAINAYNPGTAVTDDDTVTGDLYFHTLAEADFDVVSERDYRETSLMHLVTDAMRYTLNETLFSADPVIIYVDANGVLRDTLMASETDGAISVADMFRSIPLGVSPVEETPAYPLIDIYMSATEMKAGLEVGLSLGFDSSSFFLGYSGAKVEYDPNLPAFDPDNPTTTGRITKITLWDPVADAALEPWQDDYTDVIFDLTVTPDPFGGRSDELIHMATNLYIGLFIENFGLCPRLASGEYNPLCGTCANDDADCVSVMGSATCLDDAISTGLGRCVDASVPAVMEHIDHDPTSTMEIKPWVALAGYLQNLPDTDADTIPNLPADYNAEDALGALPERICCVQFPTSSSDICCHSEPCDTSFIACD